VFNLFGHLSDRLLVDDGRVHCPIRKRDIDIDSCAECSRLLEMHIDGWAPFVRCRVDDFSQVRDELFRPF
jgi:hypothetical protein